MRSSPLLSLTLATSLVCTSFGVAPTLAWAGTLETNAPAAADEDPALTEAKSLYRDGEDKFQTADYEEALVLWKKAFSMLPDGEETRGMRHALVYNIAEAHRRAYEVTRNPTHLRKAKILLDNYRADHRALYGDEPEAVKERAEVDDRIAELDKMIADSEAAGEAATPLSDGGAVEGTTDGTGTGDSGVQPQPMPDPTPKPLTPNQQWEADIKADPSLGPLWATANKRIVGGAVLSGIGIPFTVAAILMIFPATAPPDPDPLFGDPRGLWWAGVAVTGVIGLGLLIPGGVLLGQGIAKRRQVLQARPRPTGMVVPLKFPGGGGVGYAMRF